MLPQGHPGLGPGHRATLAGTNVMSGEMAAMVQEVREKRLAAAKLHGEMEKRRDALVKENEQCRKLAGEVEALQGQLMTKQAELDRAVLADTTYAALDLEYKKLMEEAGAKLKQYREDMQKSFQRAVPQRVAPPEKVEKPEAGK